jgi:chromosome segregation ATPase
MMVLGVAPRAFGKDRFGDCDPWPQYLHGQCCAGTLLPYHVSLKRADDATQAEAALARMTDERDHLQAEMTRLQAELRLAISERNAAIADRKAAVAERDQALNDRETAIAERNQARAEAIESAKVAQEQTQQSDAAKQAANAALKAQRAADAATAVAIQEKSDLVRVNQEIGDQINRLQTALANERQRSEQALAENGRIATELNKAGTELADLRQKLAIVAEKRDEKDGVVESKDEATSDESDVAAKPDADVVR